MDEKKRCISVINLKEILNNKPVPLDFLFEIPELSNMIIEYNPANKGVGTIIEISKEFHKSDTEIVNFFRAQGLTDSCFILLTESQMDLINKYYFK